MQFMVYFYFLIFFFFSLLKATIVLQENSKVLLWMLLILYILIRKIFKSYCIFLVLIRKSTIMSEFYHWCLTIYGECVRQFCYTYLFLLLCCMKLTFLNLFYCLYNMFLDFPFVSVINILKSLTGVCDLYLDSEFLLFMQIEISYYLPIGNYIHMQI